MPILLQSFYFCNCFSRQFWMTRSKEIKIFKFPNRHIRDQWNDLEGKTLSVLQLLLSCFHIESPFFIAPLGMLRQLANFLLPDFYHNNQLWISYKSQFQNLHWRMVLIHLITQLANEFVTQSAYLNCINGGVFFV